MSGDRVRAVVDTLILDGSFDEDLLERAVALLDALDEPSAAKRLRLVGEAALADAAPALPIPAPAAGKKPRKSRRRSRPEYPGTVATSEPHYARIRASFFRVWGRWAPKGSTVFDDDALAMLRSAMYRHLFEVRHLSEIPIDSTDSVVDRLNAMTERDFDEEVAAMLGRRT